MHDAVPVRRARIQGLLVVVLLAAGLVGASAMPSWASFVDQATVTTTVATPVVPAPGDLVARASCKGRTVTVSLDWTDSAAPRVSGYLVRLYLNNAWQDQATVAPGAGKWGGSADSSYVTNYTMTFTVTTLTEYGWTAESPRTARIVC
ncbi:UNVERIFIED_ORG: hypothetical protein E4P37_09970 [Bacillus sp. AZ43]